MTPSILQKLRCPVCKAACHSDGQGHTLFCTGERRHAFDFSKSGYLNLCLSQKSGDSKEAVRARSAFLEKGYYQVLADEICSTLQAIGAQGVLDAGCGEGYYTNRMAIGRDVLGVDLSKEGIDHGARTSKRTGSGAAFVVASLFEMPVADACFDAVLNVFAPCAEAEFSRVLDQNGRLVLVGAGERHLFGLKEKLYDVPYLNANRSDLPVSMRLCEKKRLHECITVEGSDDVMALFSMTPYYWRTSEADRKKLEGIDRLTTEIDFDIFIYGKEA